MRDTLQNVGFEQIRKFLPPGEDINMGNDFLVVDVQQHDSGSFIDSPFRTDAFLAIFCEKGGFDVEVNLRKFHIQDNTLLVCIPGYIIKVGKMGAGTTLYGRIVAMALSRQFISDIKFDFSKLFESRLMFFYDPRIMLTNREMSFCSKYFHLVKSILDTEITTKTTAVKSLVESLLSVIEGMVNDGRDVEMEPSRSAQTRLNILFERFMSLVSEYHSTERGMTFYATRLGITPKYLSRLIKDISGRSAPEWIDAFVIQEAKSMLRYTDDSIKEIVYKLNFTNASVFYKFFKSQTGMTPSEYRNR
ncbi:MAG: AraC family transcriptional regulator [Bacteroidales bacterium]|nr:AraC family transcriptional regulator [Bacteroidales bacterium]